MRSIVPKVVVRRAGVLVIGLTALTLFISNLTASSLWQTFRPLIDFSKGLGFNHTGWATYNGDYHQSPTIRVRYDLRDGSTQYWNVLPSRAGLRPTAWRLISLKLTSNSANAYSGLTDGFLNYQCRVGFRGAPIKDVQVESAYVSAAYLRANAGVFPPLTYIPYLYRQCTG